MTCPIFECLYEGTRGPGKTDALLMDFAQHVGQGFGAAWRGILFRRTYKQLADVVVRSKKWFYQIFPGAKFNESEFKWTFPNGEELLFRYMNKVDDYWNYHGHEYPWIGWEELTNWADLACYEIMKGCCRSSHPGMPRKYRSTCNPWGRGHNAVKAYFIDVAPPGAVYTDPATGLGRVRLFGSIYENKILLAADPIYLKRLEGIDDEALRKAWLFGDWDVTCGGALDGVWKRGVHLVRPFKIPGSWLVNRAFDWGSSKPFSLGLWAISDGTEAVMHDGTRRCWPRDTRIRVGEWYGWFKDANGNGKANKGLEMANSDIGAGIFEREQKFREAQPDVRYIAAGPADSSIFTKMDGDSIYLKMQGGYSKAAGGFGGEIFVEADKRPGSRKQGLGLLRDRLSACVDKATGKARLVMEEPGIIIFDTCTDGWIRTVPGITRSDDDPDDVDSEAEDHAYDETRYELSFKPTVATSESFRL